MRVGKRNDSELNDRKYFRNSLPTKQKREKNANTIHSWNQSHIPMPFFDDSIFFFFFFPLCFWLDFFSGDDSFQYANVSINPLESLSLHRAFRRVI